MYAHIKKGISACLIVKDEENNISSCLDSIKGYVDEIIVIDTGSNDKTHELAKSYTQKVFNFKWNDNFSDARNFSLSFAEYEFILIIDADEKVINPEILTNLKYSNEPNIGGYLVELVSFVYKNNKKEEFYSTLLRIIRNDLRIRFQGSIHEQVFQSIIDNKFQIANSGLKLSHSGYNLSAQAMFSKQMRNLNLLKNALQIEPDNYYNKFQYAKTLLALEKIIDAEKIFEELINTVSDGLTMKPEILNYYTSLLLQKNDIFRAQIFAEKSLSILPSQPFALYLLGESYLQQGKYFDSMKAFQMIEKVEIKPETALSGQYLASFEAIKFRIGRCYTGMGEYEKALIEFNKGYEVNPKDESCLAGIANIYFIRNDFDKALEYLNIAHIINPNNSNINKMINDTIVSKNEAQKTVINAKGELILSLSMIVKNEENTLEGCLQSVQNIVDEIIIVDTGSIDRTKEIALKYGAKIYDFPWIDDFAAARNESLKHCNGKWILYLDADERLSTLNINYFKNLLLTIDENIGSLICTIESDHSNLSGTSEIHRGGYPRLFRNLGYPKIHFKGRVHEQIGPSLKELGYKSITSDVKIIHLGYNQPREVMESKIERNYKMLLQHVKDEPLNGYAWFQLGQTLAQMNLNEQAENAIKFAVECGDLSDSIYASAANTLTQIMGTKGQFEEALKWVNLSLTKAPEQIYGISLKAFVLKKLNKNEEAIPYFKKAIEMVENQNTGMPNAAFDIMISPEVLKDGLKESIKAIEK